MFKRVLVANRGEIALRVIRACREMGIESVAVYSDADLRARHVLAADRTVPIGFAVASESYLSIPKLIDAARRTECDAIHPGYGFLSENPAFAETCREAELTFIGPPPEVIALMGSKIEARKLMASAGIPVVPGSTPADQSDEAIAQTAKTLGFPVFIKASAGGGGKGMRIVSSERELAGAVASARRESLGAFADSTLYLERVIERPRHVEFQILADHHGHVLHLFERECSVQRRHQKIIEESPSPILTRALRERMSTAAVKAARAANYRNAGTVEFLVEGAGRDAARFYFLEMNTRLQVEHPVTEAILGIDLVRAQIAIAAGEPLSWEQSSLQPRGHAVECRIYAEDPRRDFLPQAGRVLLYREPVMPGVRVDSGILEGDEISVHYDPILAKLIAHAETRAGAIARAEAALREYPILGVRTNIPFLLQILRHERFRAGDIHTAFLDEHALTSVEAPEAPLAVIAAAAAHREVAGGPTPAEPGFGLPRVHDPWTTLAGWRM